MERKTCCNWEWEPKDDVKMGKIERLMMMMEWQEIKGKLSAMLQAVNEEYDDMEEITSEFIDEMEEIMFDI